MTQQSGTPKTRARKLPFCFGFSFAAMLLALSLPSPAQAPDQPDVRSPQKSPTTAPDQTPKTAPQALPSYEGQKVATVELAGRPALDPRQYAALLAQRPGEPFSREKIEESVAALKHTGQFQDVQLQVVPQADGVRVLFVLQPATYYGIFHFPGAQGFSYSRLLQVANYPPIGPYTPFDVQQAQSALENFFQRNGYFLSQVRPELQTDAAHALVNVTFHVTLGRKATFGDVVVEGPTEQESRHFERILHSFMARLRGAAIRPGKTYNLKTLTNATQYLTTTLNKQDRLAAQVRLIGAKYNPDSNRADISFHVEPGPVTHVKVEGAHLWPWTRRDLLPLYQQAGVNSEVVLEGRQNLTSYFQSKGHFDAQVTSEVQPDSRGQLVLYRITRGPRHKVAAVSIAGNQSLSVAELMPHLSVKKAHFLFSHGKYSQQLLRASVNNLKGIYQAAGFRTVQITPDVSNSGGNLEIAFRVDEGPRDTVGALRIEGNTIPPEKFAPQGLKLGPGRPYSAKLVGDDRTQIISHYLDLGYLTATLRETAQPLPGQPHRFEVVYRIYEGPQVNTAAVVTLGRKNTQQRLINRDASAIQSGRPLTERAMLASESRLYTATGVFDWAEVDPRRQITTQTKEDVLIKLHEASPNVFIYGFGFEVINRGGSIPSGTVALPNLPATGLPSSFRTNQQTFYGPRGSLQYTRNNLRGKAESITLSGLAGRLDQRGAATLQDPNFVWTNWTQSFTASGEHNSENPIFSSRQALGSYQLQRALTANRTQNLFLRYSFSETGLTRLLIPALVTPENLHVRLSTVSASYVRDTRDNALDAHRGSYDTAEIDLNPGAFGSSVNFAKFVGQAAYYKRIPDGIVWANSLRLGLAEAFAGSFVPLSQEFFSGGGSTLRGFPLDGAGPQRTIQACGIPGDASTCSFITVPVGGNQLVILNSEFRYPLDVIKKNLGFVTFYDGGNVFSVIGFHGQYTNSIGVGLRYTTPIGPIRIDLGHNLNAPRGIKATQPFISIGQAF
jgi:outer membrane protein assembly complex protein YaeT